MNKKIVFVGLSVVIFLTGCSYTLGPEGSMLVKSKNYKAAIGVIKANLVPNEQAVGLCEDMDGLKNVPKNLLLSINKSGFTYLGRKLLDCKTTNTSRTTYTVDCKVKPEKIDIEFQDIVALRVEQTVSKYCQTKNGTSSIIVVTNNKERPVMGVNVRTDKLDLLMGAFKTMNSDVSLGETY